MISWSSRKRSAAAFGTAFTVAALWSGLVAAGPVEDCSPDNQNFDRQITACTQLIGMKFGGAKGVALAYARRCTAYSNKGDYDIAIADATEAIRLNPNSANAYACRSIAGGQKRDYDRALSDVNEAIRLAQSPSAVLYSNRSNAYRRKGDADRALADANEAIRLDAKYSPAYVNRGAAYALKRDYDRAIAEYSEAMRLDPKDHRPYPERAAAYAAKGDVERAITDYRSLLQLPALNAGQRAIQDRARTRLSALEARKSARTEPLPSTITGTVSPGRRVALVIGNGAYREVSRLPNPVNDARAIATTLRRLEFAEVMERYDLTLAALGEALKTFGDKTVDADWAVIYFAGHGIEMNGTTYLIPVDAKLERDAHVFDEALPLERLLTKVETARKLRLVILDACRNNPFASRMIRSSAANRSVGRGLAFIEPDAGVLVAYSAKHGTTALDGEGTNSPFAEALLANLEAPGLEVQFLFRRVRDHVLDKTRHAQEPFLYGSLGREEYYFKSAATR
jgi:tetratricopeptide (TPR) repeat protein